MKQRKTGLEDQSVYHEPIKTERVGKRWIAFTKFWVGDADLRMDVQQSGDTEGEAIGKLNKFLTGKEPNTTPLKDSTYSLVTGKIK